MTDDYCNREALAYIRQHGCIVGPDGLAALLRKVRIETARAAAEEAERWDHRAARDIRARFGVEP